MNVTRLHHRLFVAVCAFAMLPHCALSRLNATLARAREPVATRIVASSVPSAAALRLLALGHNEAVADLVWLNALSFFGAHIGLRKDPSWLNPHLDAMNGLDPRFALAYSWAGTAIMYDGEINNESVAASSAVLERGVQRFPYAWDLPFMLGINYYFEMQPSTPEERTRWRTYGAEMIGRASSLPNAPTFLAPVATSLLAAQGGGRAAYEVASRGVLWAENDLARDSLRTTIRNSGSSDALAWMDAQHHALDSLLAAPSLPTVPPTLIVLLHPDPALAAIPDDEESAAPTTSDAPQ